MRISRHSPDSGGCEARRPVGVLGNGKSRPECAAGVRTSRVTAPRRVMIRLLGVDSPRLTTRKRK